jgi:voltage-gated potassium channel Kch
VKKAKHLRRSGASAVGPIRRRELGREPSAGDRLRYRFENTLSRGTWAVILWLAALTGAVVLFAGAVIFALAGRFGPGDDETIFEGIWQSMLRVMDPGTMAGDRGWGTRLLALAITITGLLLASALIGLIATAIDQRIEQLRKGRSFVVEEGHTLILGWSPRVFTVIAELQVANENQPGSCITVLAPVDKTEMEDEIRARVPSHRSTHVVCRTGDPATLSDLAMVNASKARSVVILGVQSGGGDAEVVKAALAVLAGELDPSVPVVAELARSDAADALQVASGGRILTVRSSEVIARVTAQACREAGLSTVFQELLDFEGSEIYFQAAPELDGHTFGDAQLAYDHAVVFGRRTAGGELQINPPMQTELRPGDELVVIAEDDDTIVFTGVRDAPVPTPLDGIDPRGPEHLLVIGWNALGPLVLAQLDLFLEPGSTVDVFYEQAMVDPELPAPDEAPERTGPYQHVTVTPHPARTGLPALERALVVKGYDSVVVLGYRHEVAPAEADARTLLSLMVIDRVLATSPTPTRVVAELLDVRDVELAQVTGGDDFVVSDALGSLMMAQLSEHAGLAEVFDDLFAARGASVHLRPARAYVGEQPVSFAEIVAAARARGEVALGFRKADDTADALSGGVVVNPHKDRSVQLGPDDQVIVISGS